MADLNLHADLPRVKLLGKSVGPGTVSISPPSISLVLGEPTTLQVENTWTSAVTHVHVVTPEGISHSLQDFAEIEAGAKLEFHITLEKPPLHFEPNLTVRFLEPTGSPNETQAYMIIYQPAERGWGKMRGWSNSETFSVFGVIGVFLITIAHMIVTNT